ncbi:MAG: HlyD family efflux transporter periplasmic adaptor subunit [Alphaproteobacteria bacterium]|nr:HlyD family efflux transporter periplasmic adaptor subunit [Alphaproteobacteria bacterium]
MAAVGVLAAEPRVQIRLIGPDPLIRQIAAEDRVAAAAGARFQIGVEPRADHDDSAAATRIGIATAAANAIVLTELDVISAFRARRPAAAAELRFVPLEPVCAFAFARRDRRYGDFREAIGDRWLNLAKVDPGASGGRADRVLGFLQQVDVTFGHIRIERSDDAERARRLVRQETDVAIVMALPGPQDPLLAALLADAALSLTPIRPIIPPSAAREADLPFFPARLGRRSTGDVLGPDGYETVCVTAGLALNADLSDPELVRRVAAIRPGGARLELFPVEVRAWTRPPGPARTAPPLPASAPAASGGGKLRWILDAVVRGADETAAGLAAGVEASRWWLAEGLWEASYALGINATPLQVPGRSEPAVAAGPPPAMPPVPPAGSGPPPLPRDAPREASVREPPARPATAREPTAAGPGGTRGDRAAAPEDDDPIEVLAREIPILRELGFDEPFRRDDGSYFVPKPVQRLYGIRTVVAQPETVPLTATLPGQIVPDPNTHGSVEPSVLGRIEPPESGLPFVGQHVAKGQVLGYVVPVVGVLERSQARREIARLNSEIVMRQALLDRLRQFYFVPFREGRIVQEEMSLEGLRRERSAVMPMLAAQEILRASTSGVISASTATTGRIVKPGDTVFEIVDPEHLWVQAIAPGIEVAESAARVARAYAVTPEGQALPLGYIGSGLSLQQQAVPLLFRIEQPIAGLRVGRPVSVIVESTQTSRRGVVLPRDSVVNGASGVDEVWERTGPETFAARPVRTEPMDGERILVVAGVDPGSQVVTRGARLLIQLK